ncbi:hypothetical protein SGLAD_v1c09650 [Spiroplasma gladiatoris]|uniref:Uncharacterized protein n=1 Tax=Spiroplasma gladiatoris TaxID=2143 RepID=A0A4P7AI68_9MOLU|nr:hypothetical protein [Spiroplasma gladiatoris]QBQ08164.1 hypothetical protein SGLAD_v1c09650 [Spiroplasma gladiatoris]
MIRTGKTLSNIGCNLILSSIIPLMCLSIVMMSIKKIIVSSLMSIKFIGEWLASLVEKTLNNIQNIGTYFFIVLLIVLTIITVYLVLINLKLKLMKNIGSILGIVIGFLLIFISSIPFIVSNTRSENGTWVLITGLLFTFCGISGLFIFSGSLICFFGLIKKGVVDKKIKKI